MKKHNLFIFLCTCVVAGLRAEVLPDSLGYTPACIKVESDIFMDSPDIDVTKALYGKLAGLNVYQGAGKSSNNVSSLSIHGQAPLVLIDGFRRDIANLVANDIEECVILKDAVAAALYGTEGANGVVLITTKKGNIGKLKVSAHYQMGISTQFRAPDFADAYTYASFYNRALAMDGMSQKYSEKELDAYRTGKFPYHYPDVDWWKETNNNLAFNHRLGITFRGGSEKIKYYTVVDYMFDRGFLKYNTKDDRYSSKPTDTRLNVRTNLDMSLSPTTKAFAGISAKLLEDNSANAGAIYTEIYKIPSLAFPVRYSDGVYGGSTMYGSSNPVALLMDTGNTRTLRTILMSNLTLKQHLDFITPGLSASASVAFDYNGSMNDVSKKEYMYVTPNPSFTDSGTMIAKPVYYGKDSETLEHSHNFVNLYMRSTFNASIDYSRKFDKSGVNASVMYRQYSYITKGRNESSKTQSALFTAGYDYDDRYSLSGVINYSGSAYLKPGERFNLFYGVNGSWNISNEKFLKNIDVTNNMRISTSYGVSGWDGNLSHELYLQSYGDKGAGGYFFTNNASSSAGQTAGQLPVENLTVEKNRKATLGIDMSLLDNRLNLYAEAFWERRYDILLSGASSVSGIIGIDVSQENAGINKYKGVDFGVKWSDSVKGFKYDVYANGAFLTSEVVNENQAYQEYDYLYHTGNPVGQRYGLEVVGFFRDQLDINNSPIHTFSVVKPGDIKYKDQNGDNKIDSRDVVKMFGSNIPKFYFGFGVGIGYKRFSLSADFQGMTGVTVNLLNSPLYKPLVENGNLSEQFLKNEKPWTIENAKEATMPRLTTVENNNNYRNNSLWYRDGSFIKLRSLKLSYTVPVSKKKVADMKIFLQGTNLFSLDNMKTVDPEQLGATYPSMRRYWIGLNWNF